MMPTATSWVSPASQIAGRDHLAVQAISEHLFTEMLPGLTNVTPRVRCYSFYAWFVWALDQQPGANKNPAEIVKTFRRAECLHTLIGIFHELETGDTWSHGSGLVGRDTLIAVAQRVRDGEAINLSDYATQSVDSGKRYFKHPLGGLGQYHLGPLKDLEVLDGDAARGLRYTKEWGAALGEVYDQYVDADAFFAAVSGDRVNASTLRDLEPFCPCRLLENTDERKALTDLMFLRGTEARKQDFGHARRSTFLAVLQYAKDADAAAPGHVDVNPFLSAAYSGALPGGTPWIAPPGLAAAVDGWAVYQRHELLSVAVQGLFWAGLSALLDDGGHVMDSKAFGTWFRERFEQALGPRPGQAFFESAFMERRATQPPLAAWEDANHEIALADALMVAQKAKDPDSAVAKAVTLLLALIARDSDRPPYGPFDLSSRFLQTYEINLASLGAHSRGAWRNLSGREWLEWMASRWLVGVHLRVAMRKLRHQTQDSFRIVPLEDGLHVRDAPSAQWAQPRLGSALRFLNDLGLFELDEAAEERSYRLSAAGSALLEAERG